MVPWLGVRTYTAMGTRSTPGQGTKMSQFAAKKKKKERKKERKRSVVERQCLPKEQEHGWEVDEKGSSRIIPQKGLETFPSGGVS